MTTSDFSTQILSPFPSETLFWFVDKQNDEPHTTETSTATGIVIIIPAYNEERFIGSVVLKARRYADVVIVVDDGSTDATAEIATDAGAVVVQHHVNLGKGVALNTGFQKACTLFVPQVVVTLDGDWQHMPEEVPKVAAPILENQADIVIGSRYLESTSDVPFQRVLGHWGFTTLTNVLSGTSSTDSQSGFRAFSLRAISTLHFNSKGFSVESEMQFLANDHRLRVVETPITIRYQDGPKRSLISHGMKVLNGILGLVGQHRPLLFFSTAGFIISILGLILGLWVINVYSQTQELALGMTLLTILLCLVGTFTLFTGIILHSMRGLVINLGKSPYSQLDRP